MKIQLVNENYTEEWVKNLLLSRGLPEDQLVDFYEPKIGNLQGPECLDNIEVAASYILNSIKEHKTFGVIKDCDVDGWTSSGLMINYLREINPEINIVSTFHKHKEHGLEDCWEWFVDQNVDIVIEVDAGINDKQYHDLLGEHGIFTIVGDHHEYEGSGFSEHAIYVDNQTSPNYINKSLAGCGIAWQICRMMDKLNGTDYAFKYIDLVALGCAADVMSPLTLENRFIFDYGFSHLEDPTFKAIVAKQSFSMKDIVDYTSVAFYVAPLINACMRSGELSEKAMMYEMIVNPHKMVESHKRGVAAGTMVPITDECLRILTNVKARQQRLIDNYSAHFDTRIQSEGLNDNNIIVLHLDDSENFDAELNGLIATNFSNKYGKPCLVLRDGLDNITKGSGRNPSGSPIPDLKDLISKSPYTDFVAGHSAAFGTGIKTPCLDKFITWFNEQTSDMNFAENTYQVNFITTPQTVYLKDLCYDIAMHNNFWGGNNKQPVVAIKNIHINTKDIMTMGKNNDTIKWNVNGVDCIKFFCKDLVQEVSNSNKDVIINVIGRPSLNNWMGKISAQLLIDDIEIKEDRAIDF